MKKSKVKNPTYTVNKSVMKVIQKSIDKGGFTEFEELLNGELTMEEFIEFADNMGSSEVENASEAKVANRLSDALGSLSNHLFKTEQITKEQYDELENAMCGIPYDDSI